MSEPSGVSQSYVDGQILNLRSHLESEIRSVQSEIRSVQNELKRMEKEMKEVGKMIVDEIRDQTSRLSSDIETQTVAVIGGVAANTLVLEKTKSQIESDFDKTRLKLDLQTEASLQIEVGKKMADSVSTLGKLMAFASDINTRFQKSIEGIFLNRQLYSVNFNKIFDEYQNKIRTIGEHIFFIRDNDILPAVKAANAPLEEIHGLPFEVDLLRLKVRAQSLDETLTMLKESRFDNVLNSLDDLTDQLNSQFALKISNKSETPSNCNIVIMAIKSELATDLVLGVEALPVANGESLNINFHDTIYHEMINSESKKAINKLLSSDTRTPSSEEINRIQKALESLKIKNLISEENSLMVNDFLDSGNLKFVS